MGVKGLFSFINRKDIKGAIINCSISDIENQIQSYQSKHGKRPKILINLRAFTNFYEQYVIDVIFNGRLNKIKENFENLLSTLKKAGADLIFVSKKSHLNKDEELKLRNFNEAYEHGMKFLDKISKFQSVHELERNLEKKKYPWNESTILVLQQSAEKFGTFIENDCFLLSFTAGHVQTANTEDVFAIIGLDTHYLLHPGSWKFFFPTQLLNVGNNVSLMFKEYNKAKILDDLQLTYDQMQLLAVLGGKLFSLLENIDILKKYFSSKRGYCADFQKIIDFIHNYADAHKFPLNDDTIKDILTEIFNSTDECLIDDFKESLNFKPTICESPHRFKDEELKIIMLNNPFSVMAENILNNLPMYKFSCFLDASKTDMKNLEELTLPWIKRTSGILLKNIESEPKLRKIHYRIDNERFSDIDYEPDTPEFDIPSLKQLITGKMSSNEKLKILFFLIGNNIMSEEILQKIPSEHIMHVIIVTHLVKNNSMKAFEAMALTKTVSETIPKFMIYPEEVDVRAFRVSALYQQIFSILLECFNAVGLKEFVSELKLDNVQYQNKYNELKYQTFEDSDILKEVLNVLKVKA